MPSYNKDPYTKHFFKSFAERLLLGVRGCSWSHLTRKSSVSPSASSFPSKATTIRDPLTVGVSRLACTRTPQHATWIQVRNKTNRRTWRRLLVDCDVLSYTHTFNPPSQGRLVNCQLLRLQILLWHSGNPGQNRQLYTVRSTHKLVGV
jgi:hypothetical protein